MAKQFAWSYSKLKNFETCPKKHYEVDLAKNYSEEQDPNGPLAWGNRVHKEIAKALETKTPLPIEMEEYQPWVDKVAGGQGQLLVEQQYAITRDFKPTKWFGNDVWYRGIGDVVRVNKDVALVLDWKTGKLLVEPVQLALMAQCIFVHYPEVQHVRSTYVWLKDDCQTPELFVRADMADVWHGLFERVKQLEDAARTQTYPPKPGRLCRNWCPVQSCTYHGKGLNG